MTIHGTLRTAGRALRRNPMRAMLTTLGIIIGIGAVIAMLEIGAGSSAAVQKGIASMGANVILVMPGTVTSGGASSGTGSSMTLSAQDADAILARCPAVSKIVPVVRTRAQAVAAGRNWVPNSIYGSTADFLDIRAWSLAEGEVFSEGDVLNSNRVCLVGQTIVRELFEGRSPLGEELRIRNVAFRVVGVLGRKGANMMGMDQDDIIIAPWTTIKYRVSGSVLASANQSASTSSSSSVNTLSKLYNDAPTLYPAKSEAQTADNPVLVRFSNVDQLLASAASSTAIPTAITEITEVLRERHGLHGDKDDDFVIRDMTEMTSVLTATTRVMGNLLLCVALISLIVGGVGIMNIMLVSVTERTREIGLRMAVGARARDILRQFLVEAVTLCLVGGALGILLGHGGSMLVRYVLRWPVETSLSAMALAVIVSASVGIIFGYYPAWKASRLDPIEALRYE